MSRKWQTKRTNLKKNLPRGAAEKTAENFRSAIKVLNAAAVLIEEQKTSRQTENHCRLKDRGRQFLNSAIRNVWSLGFSSVRGFLSMQQFVQAFDIGSVPII